jgi:hypothetical protein
MQAVTRKVKAAVGKVASVFKGLFSRVKCLFVKKAKKSRRKPKVVLPAAAPAPAPAPVPAPAPAPGPAAPAPAPTQAAGKKMRARNLKKMKFYKASRRAMRKGKKMSRKGKMSRKH